MTELLLRLFFVPVIITCLAGCKDRTTDRQNSFYYVDCKYGNDNNSGKKPSEAWKTLGRASQQKLKPGSVLYLFPDNIIRGSLQISNAEGTAELPVLITSKDKKMAIIESGDSSGIAAIN